MSARPFVRLAAPAAFLAAVACGGEKAAPAADSAAGATAAAPAAGAAPAAATAPIAAGNSLADASTVAQLDSVTAAAKAGLTTLPAAAAVSLIQSFETKLKASDDAELRGIGDELDDLREHLGKTPVDGKKVGEELAELGPKVTAAAAKGGAAKATLEAIGAELTKAGAALGGKK